MSSNAIATVGDLDWSVIDDVVAKGDLSKLTVEQRTKYYRMFCESLKLNPVTQPFQYMSLNGKLVLYATKGAADQLRNINRISIEIVSAETRGDDFCVTVRATTPNGRFDEDFASVTIAGLRGDQYHNAKLKAITKAKRRVTLSICGLGINDETEVVTIPNARLMPVDEVDGAIERQREPPNRAQGMNPPTKIAARASVSQDASTDTVNVDEITGEIIEDDPDDDAPAMIAPATLKRLWATFTEMGWTPDDVSKYLEEFYPHAKQYDAETGEKRQSTKMLSEAEAQEIIAKVTV